MEPPVAGLSDQLSVPGNILRINHQTADALLATRETLIYSPFLSILWDCGDRQGWGGQ